MKWIVGLVVVGMLSLIPFALDAGRAGNPRQLPADAHFVDRESHAGPCSDARSAPQAMSPSSPWCSLERAVDAAPSGSVVVVRRGDYPALSVSARTGSRYLTLRPYRSERVSLAGVRTSNVEYLRIEGVRITGPVILGGGSHHIALARNRMTQRGITLQGGTHEILIEHNRITAPEGSGVHFSSGVDEPQISNVTIRGNHFDNIGIVGVNARNFANVLIEDNEFEGVHSWDGTVHPNVIRTFGGGAGIIIRANNIHDNSAQGLFIKDGRVTGVLVENNLIANTTGGFKAVNIYDVNRLQVVNNTIAGSVVFQGTATAVILKNNIFASLNRAGTVDIDYEDHNYISAGNLPGTGPHDLRKGLRYVNPRSRDYRLASNSVGIDAGTSTGAPARDRLGHERTDVRRVRNRGRGLVRYYDIGAHEQQNTSRPVGNATR